MAWSQRTWTRSCWTRLWWLWIRTLRSPTLVGKTSARRVHSQTWHRNENTNCLTLELNLLYITSINWQLTRSLHNRSGQTKSSIHEKRVSGLIPFWPRPGGSCSWNGFDGLLLRNHEGTFLLSSGPPTFQMLIVFAPTTAGIKQPSHRYSCPDAETGSCYNCKKEFGDQEAFWQLTLNSSLKQNGCY